MNSIDCVLCEFYNKETETCNKKMTAQEAIEIIKIAQAEVEWEYPMDYAAAFDMAIEALERGDKQC